MGWFRKRADSVPAEAVPAELPPAPFSAEILESKLSALQESIAEAGGIESLEELLTALRAKSDAFRARLGDPGSLQADSIAGLVGVVFSVRRKLGSYLPGQAERLRDAIQELLASNDAVDERLMRFSEVLGDDKKLRRGLWDFGSEILHFSDPDALPLLNRWVWDDNTESGAMREFLKGNDTLRDVPVTSGLAALMHYRNWFYEELARLGFYRDLPFLVDLVWAQAYADYAKSLSMQIGIIDAQFGAKQDPLEFVVKVLGIDAAEGRLKTPQQSSPVH